jgi:alpha-ketoglutarate-dependent taurine dioxygenase
MGGITAVAGHRQPQNLEQRQHQHGGSWASFDRRQIAQRRGLSSTQVQNENLEVLHVEGNAPIYSLPTEYLRAFDPSNFHPDTFQRNNVATDQNGKPSSATTNKKVTYSKPRIHHCEWTCPDAKSYRVEWDDGKVAEYSSRWVDEQLQLWGHPRHGDGTTAATTTTRTTTDRILWTGLTQDTVRNSSRLAMTFSHVLTHAGMKRAIETLYQYGILLVQDTPILDGGAGVAALASSLGGGSVKNPTSLVHQYQQQQQQGGTSLQQLMMSHGGATDGPLRTLYGTVWSTTSSGQAAGTSVADSAYDSTELPLHTDLTYHGDPPGLQIFTMVQPAQRGGESIFGDGFAAAEHLRRTNPAAFDTLSRVSRRYRSVDRTTGWHLEACGPVIATRFGQVTAIRHNDLDRLPDLPPSPHFSAREMELFYQELHEAHAAWDAILALDDFRLVFALKPGETMVVANQVRTSFCTVVWHSKVLASAIQQDITTHMYFTLDSVAFMVDAVSSLAMNHLDPSWVVIQVKMN